MAITILSVTRWQLYDVEAYCDGWYHKLCCPGCPREHVVVWWG